MSQDPYNGRDADLPPSSSPLSSLPELEPGPEPLTSPAARATDYASVSSPLASVKDEIVVSAKKKKRNRLSLKRTPKKSKWDAERILTDPKSPLATADLRAILSNPGAWEALSKEDQDEVLALFPDQRVIVDAPAGQARPDFASLMNNDSFRYDCAAYTDNILQGRHDPEWLGQAWAAHERRKMGDFDEFQMNKFQEEWDTELPEGFKPNRKEMAANRVTASDSAATTESTRDATPTPGPGQESTIALSASASSGGAEDKIGRNSSADLEMDELHEDAHSSVRDTRREMSYRTSTPQRQHKPQPTSTKGQLDSEDELA